ncbi:NEDD4-binding protein 1 isoform X1 [Pygocentrus nattereri]|nr:NEDD4-binding protein 1 isoform X1 [Pygocentrus nattereri]
MSCFVMALSAVPGLGVKIEGEQQMEDEFTCPGVLRGCLLDLKNTVERVFRVILTIGGEEDAYTSQDGQIWLQLKGRKIDMEAAKLFVKGVVNQEAQNEVQYPKNLHCVFCGARGLFVDCLIRITSAHIKVGSVGCLLIFGLAEPVVKAYSLITGLAYKYRNSQLEPIDIASESLDSRRTFKSLVERPEDSYTLDLLALPVVVKEALLDLFKQSGVGSSTLDSAAVSAGSRTLLELQENIDRLMHRKSTEHRTPDVLGKQNGTYLSHTPRSDFSPKSQNYYIKNKEEQPREEKGLSGTSHSQFLHCSVGVSQHTEEQQESEQQEEYLLSTGSKQEHEHLLKFFTAMGYDEQLVCRVLTRTGPREPSQVLDLIQQEQDISGIQIEHSNARVLAQEALPGLTKEASQGLEPSVDFNLIKQKQEKSGIPIEHSNARVLDQEALPGITREAGVGVNGASGTKEDDFVLGVVKKAAASCGYTEENVAEVYSTRPQLTPHELIHELQRMGMRDPENRGDDERKRAVKTEEQQRKAAPSHKLRETDFKEENQVDWKSEVTKTEKPENNRGISLSEKSTKTEVVQVDVRERTSAEPRIQGPLMQTDTVDWSVKPARPSTFHSQTIQTFRHSIRGPPQPSYPLSPVHPIVSEQQINAQMENPANRPKYKHGPPPSKTGAVVTGSQRFLESLEKPFDLQLTNTSGDSGLRQIIIDGSNVAMSHGLGMFFSCRGIALAVEYFWNRGHREITVLVPQWRQKKDPKIKEQQFLTQLQDLRLLSFTPSREVMGQRINSYDDRMMLQFAQQTDGVIVTNDNMRDLVEESGAWKEIIKKRLLQYLFAGDLFMVPDDPLGRGGPHLNDFLRKQNSSPALGSHSFAGVASSCSLASPPRAHTEVLQYRELTTGGTSRPKKSGRAPPKGEEKANRSAEETLRLKQKLVHIFPGQDSVVMMTLQCHPTITDINDLSTFILEQQEGIND